MFNIGIDLGGTNIKVGIVDELDSIIAKSNVKTSMPRPEDEILASISDAVNIALRAGNISIDEIATIGIGTPGAVNPETGLVIYANNLGFKNTEMGAKLKQLIGKDIFVENDANVAAYGEYIAGSGKGYNSVAVVTLGTGVGSGLIMDGKIVNSFNHCALEMGHTVIVYDGVPCSCGRKGCFESYASATALIRQTKEAMIENPDSKLWQTSGTMDREEILQNVDGKTAFDAMRLGDEVGIKVVENYINYLGCGLTNVINTFQPEILLIGGGICKEGENLTKPLNEYISRECYAVDGNARTKLDIARLGNDAGIIGAANLHHLF